MCDEGYYGALCDTTLRVIDYFGTDVLCGPGTMPEAVPRPHRCVLPARLRVPGCTVSITDVGGDMRVQCTTSAQRKARRGAAPLPDGLERLLPYAVSIDLSHIAPVGAATAAHGLLALARDFSTLAAPHLTFVGLRNTSLESLSVVWQALDALNVSLAQLHLDVSDNLGIRLPPVLDRAVAKLQVSVGMTPSAPAPLPRPAALALAVANASSCAGVAMSPLETSGAFVLCADGSTQACVSCGKGQFAQATAAGLPRCQSCAAGGFFQDSPGRIGSGAHCACQLCGEGTYSPAAGATSPSQCRKCPAGTDPFRLAGYRACPCLPGYYRRGRFEECLPCRDIPGVQCHDDVSELLPGYWWRFASPEARHNFTDFVHDLLREQDYTYAAAYAGYFPKPYECRNPDACLGSLAANCSTGYTGVVCSECDDSYFDWLGTCSACPALAVSVVAAVLIVAVLMLVFGYLFRENFKAVQHAFYTRRPKNAHHHHHHHHHHHLGRLGQVSHKLKEGMRALNILSVAKIIISYAQVVAGISESFTSVQWPSNYRAFIGAFQFLNINPISVLMPKCLHPALATDGYSDFIMAVAIPPGLMLLVGLVYAVRRPREPEQRRMFGAGCLRNVFFIIFLLYPYSCANIFRMLHDCTPICLDAAETDCSTYLQGDYTIECQGSKFDLFVALAYAFAVVYAAALPLALLLAMRHLRRTGRVPAKAEDGVFAQAMAFFYESYRPHLYFWEILEMLRKLLLTSVVLFIGDESYTQLTIGVFLAVSALCMHAQLRPYPKNNGDNSEFWLQYVGLASIAAVLLVGIALQGLNEDPDNASSLDASGLGVILIILTLITFFGLFGG